MGKAFKKSALQQGIKVLADETWEQINGIVLDYAKYDQNIEKGQKIRVACTAVESNIHDPYDSELLVDANRVLNRILATIKEELSGISFYLHLPSVSSKTQAPCNPECQKYR
jgi:transposase, IS5 family